MHFIILVIQVIDFYVNLTKVIVLIFRMKNFTVVGNIKNVNKFQNFPRIGFRYNFLDPIIRFNYN